MTADNEEQGLEALSDMTGAMERPKSLDQNDRTGTENINVDDLRLPRLAIAQGLSTQMIPDDSTFIADLKLFDMFNDLTSDIYGRGPITFVPLQRVQKYREFAPRVKGQQGGGGVVDLDVPHGDPRTLWTKDAENKRIPPVATEFIEFVILMLRPGKAPEPVMLSIKTTNKFNRRAADQLTSFIMLRNAPIFAGLYTVTTKSEKNDQGTFGVFVMKNAGWIPKDTPQGEKLYNFAEQFAKSLIGRKIVSSVETVEEPGAEAEPVEAGM